MKFIRFLPSVKGFADKSKLALVMFLLLFFSLSPSCSSPWKSPSKSHSFQISPEERNSLKEFFRELLFDNTGAYTLYGTKPVSIVLIQEPPTDEEREEWRKYYESLSEKEKAELRVHKARYDFRANYQKWQEIKSRFPIRQYLFGIFRLDDKNETFYFVNIETTVRALLKYYEDFRRVLGYDFDPLQVVFEVEDSNSIFWNKIDKHHALLGILLGYGEDNAWFFRWMLKFEEAKCPIGEFFRTLPSKSTADFVIYPDPHNFHLPIFRNFGLYPEGKDLLKQYKKEQKQIKALYEGKDEVEVALEWLTR